MIRKTLLLTGFCLLATSVAQADLVDDWMAGNAKTSAPAVNSTGPVQELKFAHPAPPASLVPPIWRKGLENVAKATNGQLSFKEYGAGTLLGVRDGFKGVRSGVAEWAACYPQFEGRGFELSRVYEQPFITPNNPQAMSRIFQELAPKYFVPEFDRQGVTYATLGGNYPTDIMSKKPIRKWEDLAGLKVIAQGFPPEAAKLMGITIVNVPFPEIYVAMQQGLADAVIFVDPGFVPYKIAEVAKYHTSVGLTGTIIPLCYNREWFASLAPDLQAAFYAQNEPIGQAISNVAAVKFRPVAQKAYADNGVEMITLSAEELQRWRDNLAPAVEMWIEANEKEGRPARQLIADIKALTAKYDGMSPDELMRLALEDPVMGIK
jgi:TRAP-type C4-dicarboxylate transport system substrate-binding protein